MPVTWNHENEAKLLAGLFRVCDIKVNAEQLRQLAEIIGPECTPKAITHRIAKFRNQAGAFNGGSKGKKTAADSADTPSKKRGRSTPKKTAKTGKAGKVIDEEDDDDDVDDQDDDDDDIATTSSKKVKKEEQDDDADMFVFIEHQE